MANKDTALTPDTLLLTGLPRAGTTLSCHILNAHPNVLALHEPMTPSDFNPAAGRAAAVGQIAEFAQATRTMALHEGRAFSRHKDGKVPENPVSYELGQGGLRQMDVELGKIDVSQQIENEHFTLIIKHNALFTGLLPELAGSFPVYAVVRNPLAVLASWNSVNLPVNQGRIPAGEMFSPELKKLLDATSDAIDRQLHILEWFCAAFARDLPGRVIRYEDFIARPEQLGAFLQLAPPRAASLPERVSRNAHYDLSLMEMLSRRLLNHGEAIWSFYSREQVIELMASIRAAA